MNLSALTSITKNFSTPNYPLGYPLNISCTWKIAAPPGHIVKIKFGNSTMGCMDDFVEFFDGEDIQSEMIFRTGCGDVNRQTLYSIGENMIVRFTSDHKNDSAFSIGFTAEYDAVQPGGRQRRPYPYPRSCCC